MTTTQVAARYGVSQRTVERWCTRDGMPHYRAGRSSRRILLRLRDVDAWLARRPWMLGGAR